MISSALLRNNRFVFASAVVDYLAAAPQLDLPISLVDGGEFPDGFDFVCTIARFKVISLNGTMTTGPTLNAGNDVAKTNLLASAIQVTAGNLNSINTSGLPGVVAAASGVNNLNKQIISPTTSAFKLDVTVAAVPNTATTFQGRWFFAGYIF